MNYNKFNTVSVVIPVFNESKNIDELNTRLISVLDQLTLESYEVIYIDDGSQDDSLTKLDNISKKNKFIKIISLSRNFGHQIALSAGIDFISNDIAVLMDGDLQDPPELIPELIEKIKQDYNIVYGIRKKRKENFLKKFCYFLFYRFLTTISNINIPIDSGDFSAMDKTTINHLKNFPEKNKYIRGIRSWIGLKQISFEYERDARYKGAPKYNFLSLSKLAFDGIISFSNFPLKLATMSGFFITSVCIIYIAYIIIHKLFVGIFPQGWSSLMVVVLFLGGIQLLVLGIVGEYIARIFDDVRGRPNYIIKKTRNIEIIKK